MPQTTRLNKYLAHTFGLSRREADQCIQEGRVLVNGEVAHLGNIIDSEKDMISLDNKPAETKNKTYTYVLLNKPIGYVCSRRQQGENPTIYDLLPPEYKRLKVAGRLDKDSCGLVLLTDDGDTIYELTHPKFNKQKVYRVKLDRPLSEDDFKPIEAGVDIGDQRLSYLKLRKIKAENEYEVILSEGRNRQIRRTFKALGYTVTHLERTHLGKYSLDQLATKKFTKILI